MSFPEENPAESNTAPVEPNVIPRLHALEAVAPHSALPWMQNNWLPVVTVVAVIFFAVSGPVFRAGVHGTARLERPPASNAPDLDALEEKLSSAPGARLRIGLFLVSLLFFVGLIANQAFFPRERALLDYVFATAPPRIFPAVTILDALAAMVSGIFLSAFVASIVITPGSISSGEFTAYSFFCGTMGMLGGIFLLCLFAKHRAGGGHGSLGLMPFWTTSRHASARSLLDDVALALVVYVLTFAPIILCGALNKAVVKAMGGIPDQHMMIAELLQPQPVWVLSVFLVAATAGAAFTEEILFRGGLYNGCRRLMGKWSAAFLAAAIFSAVHFIRTDFLPLMFLGLVMTWLYERTGRLFASMVFHFVNNLLSVLTILSLRDHIQ